MKKKYGLMMLFIVLIIVSVSIQSFASDNYYIFPVTRTKETKAIKRKLNIPVMIGFENKNIQKKYNDIFRNDIFDFSVKVQKESTEIKKEALKNDFPFHQCSIFVDYRVYKKGE